jgi:hypothetical protein
MAETIENPENSDTETTQDTEESTPEIESYDGQLPLRYQGIKYFPQFQDHIIRSGIGRPTITQELEVKEVSPEQIQLAVSYYCMRTGGLHALTHRVRVI